MKCNRKKPESCFSCTLPDCIDSGAPERAETDMMNEFIPDHKLHRSDKRRETMKILTEEWMDMLERRQHDIGKAGKDKRENV